MSTSTHNYPGLAIYFANMFQKGDENKLSEKVILDLAHAAGDIMEPLKAIVRKASDQHKEWVERFILSEDNALVILGARLTSTNIVNHNDELYSKIKETFLQCDDGSDDKVFLAAAIFFFDSFKRDEELPPMLLKYYENTRESQVAWALRNYGGESETLNGLLGSLEDPGKREKHWLYIWVCKAAIQEGYFNNPDQKKRIREGIEAFKTCRRTQETGLSQFEKNVINNIMPLI